MKFPYMPFYGNDFIRKTVRLTPEERWLYLHLLWLMWNNGGALDDIDDDNARALGLTLRRWKTHKQRLAAYLDFSQGQFSQKRLREVIDEVTKNADEKSRAGKAGAKARWEGYQTLKSCDRNGSGHATASKNDGRPYGRTMPGTHGRTMPLHKEDITSFSTEPARATSGKEETIPETQPSPDGARATDGPAPPALNGSKAAPNHLLETRYMKRTEVMR